MSTFDSNFVYRKIVADSQQGNSVASHGREICKHTYIALGSLYAG